MAGKKTESKDGITIISSQIESGSFSGLYLFTGTETYLIRQFAEKLIRALLPQEDEMNLNHFRGDGIRAEDIYEQATTLPFFADRRVVVVWESGYLKKGNDLMERLVGELPESTVLIFVETETDKRSRLYKRMAERACIATFDTPDIKTLRTWVLGLFQSEGIRISSAACDALIAAGGMDMNAIARECEKLISYAIESKTVTEEDVRILCESQAENKIFDMTEALSAGNKTLAIRLYEDLLSLSEPMMRLLFLITRQYMLLLKIKFAEGKHTPYAELASFAKLPPFAVKKYTAITKNYTEKELLACVNRCQQADENIKTGRERDQLAVELLIMDLLNLKMQPGNSGKALDGRTG